MTDLHTAMREWFDNADAWDDFPAIAAAVLALLDEHEQKHRRLGEPREDHTGEGLPLCQGWPYRATADALCRHLRTIAEKLGIET
jgi:hypothetical protein